MPTKEEVELNRLRTSTIFHNQDMHFHFDSRYTVEQYAEKIAPLTGGCRLVIHDAQKKEWLQPLLEYGKKIREIKPDLKIGIELSIGMKTKLPSQHMHYSNDLNPFDTIYSIHSYKTQEEYVDILYHNVVDNNIPYICHPFSEHLGKPEGIKPEILDKFIGIVTNGEVTVELNNRYFRHTECCREFTRRVKNECKYVYSTDAHQVEKIGLYRYEMVKE